MANYIDYLRWRGDLSFAQDPLNEVDAMIFASLVYLQLDGRPAADPYTPMLLSDVADVFFALPDWKHRGRVEGDYELLKAAAETHRFGNVRLVRYRSQFLPEDDTQFAAETFLLDDGSVCLAFRGTDNTLVGWKENFNMSFQQTVPSQRLAQDYVRELYTQYMASMSLCGHSKGGNLAVFAAARSSPMIQSGIRSVYNFDGPGFTNYMMGDPGYLTVVPRIHTFIPQSSVIGLLMDREEPVKIVHSTQVGILQHDTGSWEVLGNAILPARELTQDAVIIKNTIQTWLMSMDIDARNRMVESLFALLNQGNAERTEDIFTPKNILSYLLLLGTDDSVRKTLSSELDNLLGAAKKSFHAVAETPNELSKLDSVNL